MLKRYHLSLPQRFFRPATGKAHGGGIYCGVFRQQSLHVGGEGAAWVYGIEPVGYATQWGIETIGNKRPALVRCSSGKRGGYCRVQRYDLFFGYANLFKKKMSYLCPERRVTVHKAELMRGKFRASERKFRATGYDMCMGNSGGVGNEKLLIINGLEIL